MEYSFQKIDVRSGLSSNIINDIVQDKDGFIWIASNNGLQRYDMYDFVSVPQLATMTCTGILLDHLDRFWVTTREGLMMAQTRGGEFFKVPVQVRGADARVFWETTIFQDVDKRIWLKTRLADDSTGRWHVMTYDEKEKSFKPCASVFSGLTDNVLNVFADDPTHIWFLTETGIVAYNKTTQAYSSNDSNTERIPLLTNRGIPKLFGMDKDQNKLFISWVRGRGYVLSRAKGNGPVNTEVGFYEAREMLNDKSGSTWIYGEKLIRLNPNSGSLESIKIPDDRFINSLCIDRDGIIWLGTLHGILIFDPQQQVLSRSNIGVDGEIGRTITLSVLNTSDSLLIMGTWWKGLFFYDHNLKPKKYFRGLTAKDFAANGSVGTWSLFEDSKRNVWIGGQHGHLTRIDRHGRKAIIRSVDLPRETIRDITEDSNGNIWLASHMGSLVCYEPAKSRFTTVINSASNNRSITSVKSDGKFVWATSGIYLLKIGIDVPQVVKRFSFDYKKREVATKDMFHDIFHISEDELFITSAGGVLRFNKGTETFIHTYFQGGVASAEFIAPDHYVLASEGEVIEYTEGKPYFLDKTGVLFSLNASQKIPGKGFVFGTESGFCTVSNQRQEQRSLQPPRISSIRVLGKPVNVDSTLERGLVLTHDQSLFTISFSALTFFEKANVRYFLKTADQNVDLGPEHSITYQQASAGEYEIQIQYSIGGRTLSPVVKLKVEVLPPFWRTKWFIALVFLLGILIPFGLYRIKIYRYKDLEKMRQKISRDLHDEMGSNLSTINILSSVARSAVETQPQGKVSEALDKINDLSHQVLESVDDIVWSVDPRHNSFNNIVSRMRMLGGQLLESQNINFHFNVEGNVDNVQLDIERRNDFYLIYKETITNTARHAKCQNVSVKLSLKKKEVSLSVEDDGIGFDMNNVNGGGNGIDNLKARAKNLKADLIIDSRLRKGTRTNLKFDI